MMKNEPTADKPVRDDAVRDKPVRDKPVRDKLVETIGIEPTTPCLQSRCSPS